jgi:hypothetical protein
MQIDCPSMNSSTGQQKTGLTLIAPVAAPVAAIFSEALPQRGLLLHPARQRRADLQQADLACPVTCSNETYMIRVCYDQPRSNYSDAIIQLTYQTDQADFPD